MHRISSFAFLQLLSFIAGFAQPGRPDNSFGTGGITHTNINYANQLKLLPQAIAQYADGRFALGGIADNVHGSINRFKPDGTADSSFGRDGMIYVHGFKINDLIAQPDGKLLACGSNALGSGIDRMVVCRFESDGRPDRSFGMSGRMEFSLSDGNNILNALDLQSDGKIVGAGIARVGGNYEFAAVRLNTDGSFDNSFDTDGSQIIPVGLANDYAYGLAIQTDGKIVLVGGAGVGSYFDCAVVRLTASGSLDIGFNGTGKAIIALATLHDGLYTVVVQPGNKVLAGGYASNGSNADFAMIRLNPNGSFDNEFDGDGKVFTSFAGSDDVLNKLRIQPDGKIVAAGYSFLSTYEYSVARYNENGSPDLSFDGDGKLTAGYLNYQDIALSMILKGDGKIIVGGYSFLGSVSDLSIMQFLPGGEPDNSFDGDGKLTIHRGKSTDHGHALAKQPDGKLVVAGATYIENSFYKDAALVRYLEDGSLDASFGNGGIVHTAFSANTDALYAVAVQADGKIVVAGSAYLNGSFDFLVARYNQNGTPDNSFDGDGKITLNIGSSDDEALSLAIQEDQKIVVGGYAIVNGNRDFTLVRLLSNGSPDPLFDSDGILTTSFFTGSDIIKSIVIQPDGNILAAGYVTQNSGDDFGIARYLPNGQLDPGFDGDGKVTIAVTPGNNDRAECVALQEDGKILIAGSSYVNSTFDFAVVRLLSNGTLDPSFSGDGIFTVDIGKAFGTGDFADAVGIQKDGRIVVSGISSEDKTWTKYHTVIRLKPDGQSDQTFGSQGVAKITDIEAHTIDNHNAARTMVLTSNRIIIAGTVNVVDEEIAIMSLQNNDEPVSMVKYRFTGNGNFTEAANWENNTIPPNPLPAGAEIIIEPAGDGVCIINQPYKIGSGGKLSIVAGKKMLLPSNILIQ